MKNDNRWASPARVACLLAGAALLASGCSVVRGPAPETAPEPTASLDGPAPQGEAMIVALAQMGVPYARGGSHHGQGFDCSGLVQFAYGEAGVDLPRTAAEQYRFTQRLERGELSAGDLVFFRINGRGIDHVGMYLGEGRFIHAPRPGRDVEEVNLDDRYWSRRYAGAGRVPTPDAVDPSRYLVSSGD